MFINFGDLNALMEEVLVIAVCLLINALLSAFEMAFVSVPRPELRRLAKGGDKKAQRILALRENPERTLSIVQIGITLVGAISAAVGGAGAAESIVPYFMNNHGMSENMAEFLSIFLIVVPLTYLSVVIGELVPKSLALRSPIKITLMGARTLIMADRILSPAVTALEKSTKFLLRIFFSRSKVPALTTENTVEIDTLPDHHQEAVLNLAHIERRKLKDILVPWKEVVKANENDSMDDIASLVFASGFTRLPVSNNGTVLGIIHTKEFLALRETGGKDWKTTIRPALKAQSTDSLLGTLRLMQANRSHMTIVFSPNGERLGIVTFEDISEEIWGDLFDEDEDSRIRKIFVDRVKSRLQL